MRKFMVVVLMAGLLFAGCAKKETPAAVSRVKETARKLLIEGTVFLKQGDVKSAVESFANAIKAAPDDFEGYYMLSETFIHLRQYPQAIAVLSSAARQFPENGLVYYLLAVAYQGAEQTMPAIVAARRSVEIFSVKKDEDGAKRATVLLAALIQSAKEQSEAAMAANADKDAGKVGEAGKAPEAPAAAQ